MRTPVHFNLDHHQGAVTLKEALETLADHYGAETDGKAVTGLATIHVPISRDVWEAWEVVLRKIKRIESN